MKKYTILALVILAIVATTVPVEAALPANTFVKVPSGGTNSVDLNKWGATDSTLVEVVGTLPATAVGNGLTDAQVSAVQTISGGSVDNSPIGASIPSTKTRETVTSRRLS